MREKRRCPSDKYVNLIIPKYKHFWKFLILIVRFVELHSECLISGDVVNTASRIPRYSNILRNLLPSNDVSVMEIAAKTLVKLALLPGSKGAESFDFDLKRAFEWLSEERNEVSINNNH